MFLWRSAEKKKRQKLKRLHPSSPMISLAMKAASIFPGVSCSAYMTRAKHIKIHHVFLLSSLRVHNIGQIAGLAHGQYTQLSWQVWKVSSCTAFFTRFHPSQHLSPEFPSRRLVAESTPSYSLEQKKKKTHTHSQPITVHDFVKYKPEVSNLI